MIAARLLRTLYPEWTAVRSGWSCAASIVLCFAVLLCDWDRAWGQDDAPIVPELVASSSSRRLTPVDATLQVSRLNVALELTNAYQPDGIRYLAIQLQFRNAGATEVVVVSNLSSLRIGNEDYPRVQTSRELRNHPILIRGESEQTVEGLQGENTIPVPAGGEPVNCWMVFAGLPPVRELPPMTLRIETSTGAVDLELTRIENEGLVLQLERIGPSGQVGIARLSGDLNAINVPHFAELISGFAEQGVTRLVVSFDPRSSIDDDLTEEWLVTEHEEENERLKYFPVWPGKISQAVYAKLPGHGDESGELLASNEAQAVQKVTRDLMPGLDRATLIREVREGHPMIRRAILFNAGDVIANDNMQLVADFLNSTDPAFADPEIRQAAIQALRSAIVPEAVQVLEGIVRHGSPRDAVLALKSLSESQQAAAHQLAIRLASDSMIQERAGFAPILRAVGASHDERWLPLLRTAFTQSDPVVRETALEQLLRLGDDQRLGLMKAAMADSYEPIRNLAFEAMLAERSPEEQLLFKEEVLNRVKADRNDERTLLALREIRDPVALPQILKWIDERPSEDLAMITTYVEIGGADHMGELIERYPRLSPDSQAYVLGTLHATHHPEARRMIHGGLLSEEDTVYRLCKSLVVEWGDDEAVAALVDAIEKSNSSNIPRADAMIEGLAFIGSRAAREALIAMKKDTYWGTQSQAEHGLTILQQRSPAMVWLGAANEKSNSEDFQGAIEILNLAKEIEPDSGQIYNSLGFAQMGLIRGLSGSEKAAVIKEAKVNFEKALALSPDDHKPLTGVAICLANEGLYESAVRMVDSPQLIIRFHDQSVFLYNVACVYGISIDQLIQETDTPERAAKLKTYQTAAMRYLNAAIMQGFNDVRLLGMDPDLNSLRELPGFKKLSVKIMKMNQ